MLGVTQERDGRAGEPQATRSRERDEFLRLRAAVGEWFLAEDVLVGLQCLFGHVVMRAEYGEVHDEVHCGIAEQRFE